MNKCLKLTMTAVAVVLMGGFANRAAAAEGDLVVARINYIVQNEFKLGFENTTDYNDVGYQMSRFASTATHERKIWVGAIYTPTMGWAEMALPSLNASNPTYLFAPTVMSDTGYPNIIEVRFTPHNLSGISTRFVYFRVKADSSIIMWGGDGTGGDDAFGEGSSWAPPATASLGGAGAMSICCGSGHIYFGAGISSSAGSSGDSGGGGVDLGPVNTALAAIEAKLDNLPAGPAGPQGDAGPTGATGAAGAAGDAGAAGADAPCVNCDEIADAAFALACKLLTLHQPTTLEEFRDCVGTIATVSIVGSGNNICAPNDATGACAQDIDSQVQAIFDDKF